MNPFVPAMKLLRYPSKLAELQEHGHVRTSPVCVEIAPTNKCNAKCPWCFYKRTNDDIDGDVLVGLMRELSDAGVRAITWTGGGEPSLHPAFEEATAEAQSVGLRQGLFTNAKPPSYSRTRLAHPERFEWIRVSVTESNRLPHLAGEYAEVTDTGVVFNLTSDNIDWLPGLASQAAAMKMAYLQIRPALSRRIADQEKVKSAAYVEALVQTVAPSIPVIVTEYKWRDYLRQHDYPVCYGHNITPFVWWDGLLGVCGYRREPEYILGDLKDRTFQNVWDTRSADKIHVDSECQHCCKLHEINKSLAIVMGDAELTHKEFL